MPAGAWGGAFDAAPELARAVDRAIQAAIAREGRLEAASPLVVMASFADPASALEASLAIARLGALPSHDHGHSPASPQVMVGVGHGPILRSSSVIVGPAVSVAWRLATVAAPSEVLLSDESRAIIPAPPGVGMFRMQGVREAVVGAPGWVVVDYRDPTAGPVPPA